jgi:hypothetical protein
MKGAKKVELQDIKKASIELMENSKVALRAIIIFSPDNPVRIVVSKPSNYINFGEFLTLINYELLF